MKNKNLCVAPWNQVYINAEGYFFHCCMAEPNSSPIRHNGQVLHVSTVADFSEVLNSSDSLAIKKEMLAGIAPSACQKCTEKDRLGPHSYKNYLNAKYPETYQKITEETGDILEFSKVEFVDVRPGNNCNLKCRMCYPVSSKLWIDEWVELFPDSLPKERILELRNIHWQKNPLFWKMLEKNIDSIHTLHFAGGEPLYINEINQFLRSPPILKEASRIELSYNTNLTSLSAEHLQIWEKYKGVRLMISIDGTDQVNSYIRYPSKWKNIQENLEALQKASESVNFIQPTIVVTTQILNVHNHIELMEYIIQANNQVLGQRIKFNLLTDPDCYSLQALPAEMKKKYYELFVDYALKLKELKLYSAANEFLSIANFMMEKDLSHHFPEALRRIAILDKSRSQSIKDISFEIYQYMQEKAF